MSDQDVLNSTTYVDSDLKVNLAAGKTYWFDVSVFVEPHAAPDMKTCLHFTGTASNVRYAHVNHLSSGTAVYGLAESAFDIDVTYTGTGSTGFARFFGTVTTVSAGVLSLQFAQLSTNATNPARLKAGSCMWVRDVTP